MAIETSATYKTAIKADTEMTRFQAEFSFVPPGAAEGATIASGNEASISQKSQLCDGTREMPAWSTWEWNRWILDGSFSLLPVSFSGKQTGYWSQSMSGSDKTFSEPKPYYDYVMDAAYDIIGVTLFFDYYASEWATSVTIQYYDISDTLLQEKICVNSKAIMAVEMVQTGVKWVRVILNSWNIPGRYAKTCEMLPGEVFIFDPDNTFSFEFSEKIVPFNTSLELPYFILQFDNSEKKFNIVNPAGLMAYLRKLMQIMSKIGILESSVYEHIKTGDFYIYAWPDTTQNDTAQFTCKPLLAFKNNIYYVSPGNGTQTVADAAAIIFSAAGITNYTIDSSLQSVSVNQNIGSNVPLPNAAGQLAVAAGGYWKIERDGSYSLKPWTIPASTNTVDYDNMWEKPDIEQGEKFTSVNVKYYTYDSTSGYIDENDNIVTAATDDGNAADDICSCFVPSADRANAIGALALEYYAMRLKYSVSFRGDMSIEAGDIVTVENDYTNSDVFVMSHTISWNRDDKLSGSFDGVSAV